MVVYVSQWSRPSEDRPSGSGVVDSSFWGGGGGGVSWRVVGLGVCGAEGVSSGWVVVVVGRSLPSE